MQLTRTQLSAAEASHPAGYSRRRACAGALLAICFCLAGPAAALGEAAPALTSALDRTAALRDSQAAVGRVISDYTLRDREGRPVRLSNYRGKPLLVSFIYTGCFEVCPTTTKTLQKAVSVATAALGTDGFNVISVGFNQPADSPQALKAFAAQYGVNTPNWHFLSPPAAIVPDLARDFGFSFVATAGGYDHLLQISVVDATGHIYRQVYGADYAPDELIEPLKQLIAGAPVANTADLSSIIERVRLLCSVYDPATGTYRVSYGLVFEIAGFATFLAWIVWFFFGEWLARRRLARQSSA